MIEDTKVENALLISDNTYLYGITLTLGTVSSSATVTINNPFMPVFNNAKIYASSQSYPATINGANNIDWSQPEGNNNRNIYIKWLDFQNDMTTGAEYNVNIIMEGDCQLSGLTLSSGDRWNITSGVNLTMSSTLTPSGDFNVIDGNVYNANVSGTKFNLTNGVNITVNTIPTTPSDPVGWQNISKYINLTSCGGYSTADINITYSDSDLGNVDESTLVMQEYNETTGIWTQVTDDTGVNTAGNYVWANGITSFSIYAPLGVGNEAPYQTGEAPTNGSTNVCPIPDLYVICIDNNSS